MILMQNSHIILVNLDFHAVGTNDNNGYLTVGTSIVHGDFDGRSGTTAFHICCLILGNRTTSKAKDCSTNMVSFVSHTIRWGYNTHIYVYIYIHVKKTYTVTMYIMYNAKKSYTHTYTHIYIYTHTVTTFKYADF